MTASDKKEKIEETLKRNDVKCIYIQTALKCTKVMKKHLDRFAASGMPLFKADNDSLYMANGKNYVCIDWCKFTVEYK